MSGDPRASLNILETSKNNNEAQNSRIKLCLLLEADKIQEAEIVSRNRMHSKPSSLFRIYDYAVVLHLKIKDLFNNPSKLKNINIEEVFDSIFESQKLFRKVMNDIPKKYLLASSSNVYSKEESKRRKMIELRGKAETELFMIQQNEEKYKGIVI